MGLFSSDGELEIDCNTGKEQGQLICQAKKGNKTAIILAQVSPDGGLNIKSTKGNVELQERLKEFMGKNYKIKPKMLQD